MTDTFTITPITPKDIPLLWEWFQQPHVQEWWPIPTEEECYEKFLARIRSKDTFGYLVLHEHTPIGYVQYYLIDRNNPKSGSWLPPLPHTTVGTDQFIGEPTYLDKGYGTAFIKVFITFLHKKDPTLTTIIVDPDPANTRAIACYRKVGFVSMGECDAPWGKALLMRYDINTP